MNIKSFENVKELLKESLDKTKEINVQGYCSYGKSIRNDKYRYCSLVEENSETKIDLLEGEEKLIDGMFYVLKVKFYLKKNSNEYGLRVIEIIGKLKNKFLLNQDHFIILKDKIDKGYINIDNYLHTLIKISTKIIDNCKSHIF